MNIRKKLGPFSYYLSLFSRFIAYIHRIIHDDDGNNERQREKMASEAFEHRN